MTVKAKGRSPWDGHDPHPVVLAIQRRLERRGFALDHDWVECSWYYRWVKKGFAEGDFFVEIAPNKSPKGSVDFSVDLGVSSWRYTQAENVLKTWECNPASVITPDLVPFRYPLDLLRIALHWLMLNADLPVRRLTWNATIESAEECAEGLGDDLDKYGLPFLAQILTSEKLIHLLQNIESYPKRTTTPGPRSPEPSLCAALLLYCRGDSDAALRELETGFRQDVARYKRTWANDKESCDDAIRIRQCKIDRYRDLFSGKVSIQLSSAN